MSDKSERINLPPALNLRTKEIMEMIVAKLKAHGIDNETAARDFEEMAKEIRAGKLLNDDSNRL